MKYLIIFISIFTFQISKAYDFVKNTPMDQTVETLKSKYKNSMRTTACQPDTAKGCMTKYKSKCVCYDIPLMRYASQAENLFLTAYQGKIVEFNHKKTFPLNKYQTLLKPVEEFSGDEKPDKVYSGNPSNGIQVFIMEWKNDDLQIVVGGLCPLEKVGGEQKVKRKLRQCFEQQSQGSRVKSLSFDRAPVQVEY